MHTGRLRRQCERECTQRVTLGSSSPACCHREGQRTFSCLRRESAWIFWAEAIATSMRRLFLVCMPQVQQ